MFPKLPSLLVLVCLAQYTSAQVCQPTFTAQTASQGQYSTGPTGSASPTYNAATTLVDCQNACTNNVNCVAILTTGSPPNGIQCYLHTLASFPGNKIPLSGALEYSITRCLACTNSWSLPTTGFYTSNGSNLPQSNSAANLADCQTACVNNAGCLAIMTTTPFACYIHTSLSYPGTSTSYNGASEYVLTRCNQGAVNGGWSSWSSFGACSVTCGTGTQISTRTCTNPSPSGGGQTCLGNSQQSQSCTGLQLTCSVGIDGQWSSWSVGLCSVTCGTGSQTLTRTCNNPPPQNGGQQCQGLPTSSQTCNQLACAGLTTPTPGGCISQWSLPVSGSYSTNSGNQPSLSSATNLNDCQTACLNQLTCVAILTIPNGPAVQCYLHTSRSYPGSPNALTGANEYGLTRCGVVVTSGPTIPPTPTCTNPTWTLVANRRSMGAKRINWLSNLNDCQNYCFNTLSNCIAVEIDTSQAPQPSQCWVHVALPLYNAGSNLAVTYMTPFVNQYKLNRCPFSEVGCYVSNSQVNQAMQSINSYTGASMTREACVAFCQTELMEFAVLQNGNACACLSVFNPQTFTSSNQCNVPCAANQFAICGGQGQMYSTIIRTFGSCASMGFSTTASRMRLYPGYNSLGGVQYYPAGTPSDCINYCVQSSATCIGVDFNNNDGTCWIYTSALTIKNTRDRWSIIDQWRIDTCSASATCTPTWGSAGSLGFGNSNSVPYYTQSYVSLNNCQSVCVSTQGCKGIDYDTTVPMPVYPCKLINNNVGNTVLASNTQTYLLSGC